jgi:hypothetical protein
MTMTMIANTLRRLRRNNGQVGLEMLCVLFAWLIAATMMVNLLFYFGSAMLMQSTVNRAALQAGALGCATTGADAVVDYNRSVSGLGVGSVQIVARSPGRASGNNNPFDDNYWVPNMNGMFAANGDLVGGDNASCSARNALGSGRYIIVQVRYRQHLWLFGSVEVRRDASVISHNLREV